MKFRFAPLTIHNWHLFETLFGERGACGGCWCMNWRLTSADYNSMKGAANKKAMRSLVKRSSPGILAYENDQAVGWRAVAPREEYVRLNTSKLLGPVDEQQVWSVSCFFITKQHRRKGLSTALLKAAARFAFSKGAHIVEGYPVVPKKDGAMPGVFAWTGLLQTFKKAGFTEVERRSETRPIMRLFRK